MRDASAQLSAEDHNGAYNVERARQQRFVPTSLSGPDTTYRCYWQRKREVGEAQQVHVQDSDSDQKSNDFSPVLAASTMYKWVEYDSGDDTFHYPMRQRRWQDASERPWNEQIAGVIELRTH